MPHLMSLQKNSLWRLLICKKIGVRGRVGVGKGIRVPRTVESAFLSRVIFAGEKDGVHCPSLEERICALHLKLRRKETRGNG